MSSYAVGIPTVNRADLLKEAMDRYKVDCPGTKFFIIDNGSQGLNKDDDNVFISEPGNNIGVAASWNRLCQSIFNNHDYAIILNDDIVMDLRPVFINEILSVFPFHDDNVFILSEKQWSVFVISKKVFTLVGLFDEEFYPAYFEDNDYNYRMKIAGVEKVVLPQLNPIVYRRSMTSQKDQNINSGFMKNREYYINKWGGLPGKERFVTPFGK